jgi:hypothetical protein
MLRSLVAASFVATLLVACGSSESSSPESPVPSADGGGGAKDSGALVADASSPSVDAGSAAADAGTPSADAGSAAADAGTPSADAGASSVDAGRADAGSASTDAGPACHALAFGQPESIFIVVPSSQMGALTGGTIVDGTYDLVAVETSTASLSSYGLRSTWRFAGNTVEQIDQLRSSSLGPVTVRTGSISVSGATISRTYTCGSTDATVASLNYDSKVVGGIQTIRVMSGGLRFTYEKR